MQRVHRARWLRPTAGISLFAVVSLTCAPICGNALDVDSVSCCQRHGCIPAGHNQASIQNPLHASMSMTPVSCDSLGFDTQSCCLEGELTYPTAQVRASAADGSSFQVAVGFAVPLAPIPSRFCVARKNRPFAESPPTPLYTLHATFRI